MHECTKPVCSCQVCCLNPILGYPNCILKHNSSDNHSSTLQYDFATFTSSSLYPNTHFTNHETLPPLPESSGSFIGAFPHFLETVEADQIRSDHFPHLALTACLDYSGHSLFSHSQLSQQRQQQQQQLQQQQKRDNDSFYSSVASTSTSPPPQGRPYHTERLTPVFDVSFKPSTLESALLDSSPRSPISELESMFKTRIMRFLNVSPDDYAMVFTANYLSSLKIVAECYPFGSNRDLITVYDHENEAVEAMIESSRRRGARTRSAEFKWPKLKIHCDKLKDMIVSNAKKKRKCNKGLFVFPLQSKVTGTRYSYLWMSLARENGWHVLLDETGLSSKEMDTLGLSLFKPDFIVSTFYKVFGEDPSGFSCLFVKKSIIPLLNYQNDGPRSGIISIIPQFEDKVSSFSQMGIEKMKDFDEKMSFEGDFKGLDYADSLGLVLIGLRTRCLINWLLNALLTLRHPHSQNEAQLVSIYGPKVRFDRGPSLAFNLFDWKKEKIDSRLVQRLADRNGISLEFSSLKNIWFLERYEDEKMKKKKSKNSEDGMSVVSVSIGFLSNFEDVYRVWVFVSRFLDADFVEKERWRYTALNQKTIEV